MNEVLTVKDVIAHLQTLPQDMEVWSVWDESGQYAPLRVNPGRIDTIREVRRGNVLRWEESFYPATELDCRKVCILEPPHRI